MYELEQILWNERPDNHLTLLCHHKTLVYMRVDLSDRTRSAHVRLDSRRSLRQYSGAFIA
jgi:hypothetical protein